MTRSVGGLAPDRMTSRGLWGFVFSRLAEMRWERDLPPHLRELYIKELQTALQELYMRGNQLELCLDPQTEESR